MFPGAPEYHGCIVPVLWQASALNRCPPLKTRQEKCSLKISVLIVFESVYVSNDTDIQEERIPSNRSIQIKAVTADSVEPRFIF